MRQYELVLVIGPQVPDDEVQDTFDRLIRRPVESNGGEVQEIDQWGRRKLAYPINKQLEGHYVVAQLRLEPPQIPELQRGLTISEEVLRHLFVRRDEAAS